MKDSDQLPVAPRILTVKEMDPDDQPRERALKHGCAVLPTADLWALILRTGVPGKPITEMCRDLMHTCDGKLFNLERMQRSSFMKVPGIGSTKALQIEAVMELIRRYCCETVGEKVKIRCSEDIYKLMRYVIGNLPHEEVWVLFLNRQNEVMSRMRVTQGSSVASVFDLKKILKEALARDAESVVMCHNHPSGARNPSVQDDQITRKLSEACTMMDLRFIDHVIVTTTGFYSYADQGRI